MNYIEILEQNKQEIDRELKVLEGYLENKEYDSFWKGLVVLLGKCGIAIKLCEDKLPEIKQKIENRIGGGKDKKKENLFLVIPKTNRIN